MAGNDANDPLSASPCVTVPESGMLKNNSAKPCLTAYLYQRSEEQVKTAVFTGIYYIVHSQPSDVLS